jgi:hypothetical protein
MKKPISPTTHSLIDYGMATLLSLAPTLLNLRGPAKRLSYAFGGEVAGLNAMTANRVGLTPTIPFRTGHRYADLGNLAAMAILPIVTGAVKHKKARWFFLGVLVAAAATALLTDWDGDTEPNGEFAEFSAS